MIRVHYHNINEANQDPQLANPVGHIVLQPNNSMTWTALKFFLTTLLTISFCIAIGFSIQGYWMILPFTVLEMSIVGGCLYYIARRNHYQEVLYFSAQEIIVETGRTQIDQVIRWPRYFAKFLVERSPHPWYAEKIFLRRADEQIELGRFLTQPEKRELLSKLREMIAAADRATVV